MIHLDANLLIALIKTQDVHHAAAARLVAQPGPFGTSSVAWMEFRSKPVHATEKAALQTILNAGIIPFDSASADIAGELYRQTGSNKRTRLDTMIAAGAILVGAKLATVNLDDFAPFVPHGLKLLPLR
jgi:predicted nucleic acid-binding protein